jgi:hypothetical protein
MQLMDIASLYPSYALIWVSGETEVFLQMGLDRQITKQPVGKSVGRVRCGLKSKGNPPYAPHRTSVQSLHRWR